MAREIKSSLENHLERFEGPEEQKMFAELSQEVDNVFAKVAGWFRRPETGFVPASIKDICRIIDLEAGLDENLTIVRGNALDTYYYGISVHRLYDCLAVLIQNAGKHGDSHSPIELNCKSTEIPGTNLHQVEISVLSTVNEEEANDKIQRIKSALSAVETGRDMVTEGFSGLKKLKYITKLNEGQHTVEMANYENQVELRFRLKVEVTSSGGEDEENTSD